MKIIFLIYSFPKFIAHKQRNSIFHIKKISLGEFRKITFLPIVYMPKLSKQMIALLHDSKFHIPHEVS